MAGVHSRLSVPDSSGCLAGAPVRARPAVMAIRVMLMENICHRRLIRCYPLSVDPHALKEDFVAVHMDIVLHIATGRLQKGEGHDAGGHHVLGDIALEVLPRL